MKRRVSKRMYKGQSDKMSENARRSNKKMRPDGFIYIAKYGYEDIYKIGVSTNVKRRIYDLDSSCPKPVILIESFWFKNVYEMEECIHDNFKEDSIRREWFKINSFVIESICSQLRELSNQKYYLTRL